MKKVVILGAAGRDFHDFNVLFRNNPDYRVVAFTATQIPDIAGRKYPTELAGKAYPNGIPIVDVPAGVPTRGTTVEMHGMSADFLKKCKGASQIKTEIAIMVAGFPTRVILNGEELERPIAIDQRRFVKTPMGQVSIPGMTPEKAGRILLDNCLFSHVHHLRIATNGHTGIHQ